jgi:hypothetical protein
MVLLAPLAVLGLYALVTVAWSPAAPYGMEKLTLWAFNGLVPAVAVVALASTGRPTSWRLILAASVLYALALVFLGEKWEQGLLRQTLLGQNPIWAARAVLTGGIIAVLGPFPVIVKIVVTPFLVLAGAMTLSLGPLVGMILGVIAGLTVLAYRRDQSELGARRSPVAVPLLAVALGVSVVVVMSGALEGILGPLGSDQNVAARSGYLEASLPLFLQAPLFGIGIGGFSAVGIELYPHNLVAEIAVELGMVGLLALGVWVFMAPRAAASSPLLLGLVVGTGAFALFSGSLGSQTEFWLFSALAVAAGRLSSGPSHRSGSPSGATEPSRPSALERSGS